MTADFARHTIYRSEQPRGRRGRPDPWILLAPGNTAQEAVLASALVYVPVLLTAVPAGAVSDRSSPLRLTRIVTAALLAACALYPVAALAGRDWFVLVLLSAVAVGSLRNFSEGALFRANRGHDHRRRAPAGDRCPNDGERDCRPR